MMASVRIYTIALIVVNNHFFTLSSTVMSTFPSGIWPFGLMHSPQSYAFNVTMVLAFSYKFLDLCRENSKSVFVYTTWKIWKVGSAT